MNEIWVYQTMMKQQEKNYYIQQKLPKVSMQLLEKKETNLMKKKDWEQWWTWKCTENIMKQC